jgi:hypothetical protein
VPKELAHLEIWEELAIIDEEIDLLAVSNGGTLFRLSLDP